MYHISVHQQLLQGTRINYPVPLISAKLQLWWYLLLSSLWYGDSRVEVNSISYVAGARCNRKHCTHWHTTFQPAYAFSQNKQTPLSATDDYRNISKKFIDTPSYLPTNTYHTSINLPTTITQSTTRKPWWTQQVAQKRIKQTILKCLG